MFRDVQVMFRDVQIYSDIFKLCLECQVMFNKRLLEDIEVNISFMFKLCLECQVMFK